jgi:two-component system, chemotaxis family, sensor kinase CheA
MSGSSDLSEYLNIFLDEAEEQIETLDQGLLGLEKGPQDPGLLQEIFRAAHSLKSSSAAMGFATMSRLTHAAENVLDKLRSKEMEPGTAVIDALLAAVDVLKKMKETVRGGGSDEMEIEEVTAALGALTGGAVPAAPSPASDAPMEVVPIETAPAPTDERAALLPGEESVHEIALTLSADCDMPGVRAQIALIALEAIGKIDRTLPSREELAAGHFDRSFSVILIRLRRRRDQGHSRYPLGSDEL